MWCYGPGGDLIREIQDSQYYALSGGDEVLNPLERDKRRQGRSYAHESPSLRASQTTIRPLFLPPSSPSTGGTEQFPMLGHPCDHFAFPPPPPKDKRRIGPRRKYDFSTWVFECSDVVILRISSVQHCGNLLMRFLLSSVSACPVCYVPVEQAIASMPRFPSASPVLRALTYVHDENPVNMESHSGSGFGGYPSLEDRDAAFDIREAMTVHCGLVIFVIVK